MKISNRRKARRLALQAVYQWQLADLPVAEIEAQFLADISSKVDVGYFQELLRGIIQQTAQIDEQFAVVLDRKKSELNPVELAALRIATYELLNRIDIPYRVVINEALELTKIFGTVEGYKYVNGVLDKVARKIRRVEVAAKNAK